MRPAPASCASASRSDLGEARASLARLAETITTQGGEVAQAVAGQRTQLDGMEQTITAALRESAGSQAALSAAIEGKQVALNTAITGKQDALAAAIETKHGALGAVLQEQQDALNVAVTTQFAKFRDEASAQLAQLLAVDERLESSWGRLKGDFDAITRSLVQISRAVDVLKNELTVKLDDGGRSSGVDGLLGRVLQPSEYERDVEIEPGSNQRVSFAVKLSDNPVTRVWLPIGTLPVVRGYNELVAATVYSDPDAMKSSSEIFERSILAAAEDFSAKFVCPPRTPNLAVLVAPNDDLFDEIARRDSLVDSVGRNFHVLIAGPSTLPTLLAALRMAFRGTSVGRPAALANGPRSQMRNRPPRRACRYSGRAQVHAPRSRPLDHPGVGRDAVAARRARSLLRVSQRSAAGPVIRAAPPGRRRSRCRWCHPPPRSGSRGSEGRSRAPLPAPRTAVHCGGCGCRHAG